MQGEVSGWVFSYWSINGVRAAGPNRSALPSVRFVVDANSVATAVYIRSSEDTDADGLPDWYEWQQFGDLSQTPASDADGDGLSNSLEQWRGYSPAIADALSDGGIASRRSGALRFVSGSDARYRIKSEPPGYVDQEGIVARGTVITTPALQGEISGWVFSYWKVDGARQAGASGAAPPSIRVVVDGGRSRRARFDPASGMSRLVTERVTRADFALSPSPSPSEIPAAMA
jgi:hypothetical protein